MYNLINFIKGTIHLLQPEKKIYLKNRVRHNVKFKSPKSCNDTNRHKVNLHIIKIDPKLFIRKNSRLHGTLSYLLEFRRIKSN